ncbi:hypothetical protein DENSPDRAFT_933662 [Dentipellis sp. KUC8613]|nr:hypothetical protein DENSPDRAFT_933662 [Dentipellis sp. KUC8613]
MSADTIPPGRCKPLIIDLNDTLLLRSCCALRDRRVARGNCALWTCACPSPRCACSSSTPHCPSPLCHLAPWRCRCGNAPVAAPLCVLAVPFRPQQHHPRRLVPHQHPFRTLPTSGAIASPLCAPATPSWRCLVPEQHPLGPQTPQRRRLGSLTPHRRPLRSPPMLSQPFGIVVTPPRPTDVITMPSRTLAAPSRPTDALLTPSLPTGTPATPLRALVMQPGTPGHPLGHIRSRACAPCRTISPLSHCRPDASTFARAPCTECLTCPRHLRPSHARAAPLPRLHRVFIPPSLCPLTCRRFLSRPRRPQWSPRTRVRRLACPNNGAGPASRKLRAPISPPCTPTHRCARPSNGAGASPMLLPPPMPSCCPVAASRAVASPLSAPRAAAPRFAGLAPTRPLAPPLRSRGPTPPLCLRFSPTRRFSCPCHLTSVASPRRHCTPQCCHRGAAARLSPPPFARHIPTMPFGTLKIAHQACPLSHLPTCMPSHSLTLPANAAACTISLPSTPLCRLAHPRAVPHALSRLVASPRRRLAPWCRLAVLGRFSAYTIVSHTHRPRTPLPPSHAAAALAQPPAAPLQQHHAPAWLHCRPTRLPLSLSRPHPPLLGRRAPSRRRPAPSRRHHPPWAALKPPSRRRHAPLHLPCRRCCSLTTMHCALAPPPSRPLRDNVAHCRALAPPPSPPSFAFATTPRALLPPPSRRRHPPWAMLTPPLSRTVVRHHHVPSRNAPACPFSRPRSRCVAPVRRLPAPLAVCRALSTPPATFFGPLRCARSWSSGAVTRLLPGLPVLSPARSSSGSPHVLWPNSAVFAPCRCSVRPLTPHALCRLALSAPSHARGFSRTRSFPPPFARAVCAPSLSSLSLACQTLHVARHTLSPSHPLSRLPIRRVAAHTLCRCPCALATAYAVGCALCVLSLPDAPRGVRGGRGGRVESVKGAWRAWTGRLEAAEAAKIKHMRCRYCTRRAPDRPRFLLRRAPAWRFRARALLSGACKHAPTSRAPPWPRLLPRRRRITSSSARAAVSTRGALRSASLASTLP